MKGHTIHYNSIVRIHTYNRSIDWFQPHIKQKQISSIGTGFFINNNGYILTCSHVVETSIQLYVSIPAVGKEKFTATIVSVYPDVDLALIKINKYKNKYFLKLGNSDKLKTQDKLTVVGYPLGQERLKYTTGIFSGLQDGLLQTDAPINPGNSGGPMINAKGHVVGVNASKIKSSVADNVGFAVPINNYIVVSHIMKKHKIIYKPEFLASFSKTNKIFKEYYNNPKSCSLGLYVRELYPHSPLFETGIQKGDTLCQITFQGVNYDIDNFGEINVHWSNEKASLFDLLYRMTDKDLVEITYWRKSAGKLLKGETRFHNYNKLNIVQMYPPIQKVDYEAFGGIIVMPLTLNHLEPANRYRIYDFENFHNLSRYFDPHNQTKQLLILTHIFSGSSVYSAEILYVGDIIKSVNGIDVSNLDEYREAYKKIRQVNGKLFIVIETLNNRKCILDFKQVLKEEPELMEDNGYESVLFDDLNKKMKLKQ